MPSPKIPIVTDILQKCHSTLCTLPLWKTKEIPLTIDNWRENLFVLSDDLAAFFAMRHRDFLHRIFSKLQKNNHLSDQARICARLIAKGRSAQVSQQIHALNATEIGTIIAAIAGVNLYDKKVELMKNFCTIEDIVLQEIDRESVVEETLGDPAGYPLLTDVLELYETTEEGTQLWKTKGLSLSLSNVLDNVFMLSIDIARFFSVRHYDLVHRNITKLQREGYLPDHLRKIALMISTGKGARKLQVVYALTRHYTYRLVMDLVGPKAREKKYQIVERLEQLEIAILQGAYQEATARVLDWDGVTLLKEFGFKFSLEQENIATRKDILDFLQLPAATLTNFLQRNSHQISPIKLNHEQRLAAGIKCSRLYGYSADDVLKTVFWLDSPMGVKIKQTMFGKVSLYARPDTNQETGWHSTFLVVFRGFGLRHNFSIGAYKVDFLVAKLAIILECDENRHKHYNQEEEAKREKWLLQQGYAIVRFDSKVDLQTLFNGILQAKPGKLVKVRVE